MSSSRRTTNRESTSRRSNKVTDKPTQIVNLREEPIPEHVIDLTVDSPVIRRRKKSRRTIDIADSESPQRQIVDSNTRLNCNPGNNTNVNLNVDIVDTIVIDDSEIEIGSQSNRTADRKESCNGVLTSSSGNIAGGVKNPPSQLGSPPDKSKAVREKKQSSCPICLEKFFDSSIQVMTTKCGHLFCEPCLKNSIQLRKKCPVCTSSITLKSCIRLYL